MTYGEIFTEFTYVCECNKEIQDWRPCHEFYGVPRIPYAIVVWLEDGSKIIYVSENARKIDEERRTEK